MLLFVTFLAAFATNYVLTRVFLNVLRDRAIVALPNQRSMHDGAVPKGGGAPLILVALAVSVALWPLTFFIAIVMAATVALAAISWMDDVGKVSKTARFCAHLGASIACVLAMPGDAVVFQGVFPLALDRLIAVGALALFINFYNFMDGIDGIAGVETLAIAAGYVAVTSLAGGDAGLQGLAIAIAGAAAAFLIWNWHPARIFLGDVGSIPLGLLMGVLMLDLAWRTSLAAALLLPLYYVADAGITLLHRLVKREKIWRAHRDHFYQRAAQALDSHEAVVARVAACNLVLIGAAILSLFYPLIGFAAGVGAVGVLLFGLARSARYQASTET